MCRSCQTLKKKRKEKKLLLIKLDNSCCIFTQTCLWFLIHTREIQRFKSLQPKLPLPVVSQAFANSCSDSARRSGLISNPHIILGSTEAAWRWGNRFVISEQNPTPHVVEQDLTQVLLSAIYYYCCCYFNYYHNYYRYYYYSYNYYTT